MGKSAGWDRDAEAVMISDHVKVPRQFWAEWTSDDPASADPSLRMTFVVEDGGIEVESVLITARPGGRRIRRSLDLYQVSLRDRTEEAFFMVASPVLTENGQAIVKDFPGLSAVDDDVPVRDRRLITSRSSRVNPETLRKVATIFRASETPLPDVMELLGVGERSAKQWKARARQEVDPDTGRPYLEGN